MSPKVGTGKPTGDRGIKTIHRKTRKPLLAEEKIHLVPDGLRGQERIAALYRRRDFKAESKCAPSPASQKLQKC